MGDDQAAQPRPPRLVVPRDASVVADQRIRHQHDLARVRRVRGDLLVAAVAGIDDQVAAAGDGRAERNPVKDGPIFERQDRRARRADARIDDAVGRDQRAPRST